MGILNVTPDSFFQGSRASAEADIIAKASQILAEGGKIIDIGAESTRPGAEPVSEADELKRLIPAIKLVRKSFPDAIISADTYKAKVAEAAVDAGADIINDISGGAFDKAMFAAVARLKVPYILMHSKGRTEIMQQAPFYENVLKEVMLYFSEKIRGLRDLGLNDIILDPGFGFAKSLEHNYILLDMLEEFKIFELPLMLGVSRKRMINEVLNIKAAEALNGTTVINTIGLLKGAQILRVHDVKAASEAVKIVTFAKNTGNVD
ncbi:MAG: dihydropteroate synthase [Bacteroidetes bacterium]|nr:dihydropteroate synthase [Bacteroidota bacterium]